MDGFWDVNRVQGALLRATHAGMGVPMTVEPWRCIAKAMETRSAPKPRPGLSKDSFLLQYCRDVWTVADAGGYLCVK